MSITIAGLVNTNGRVAICAGGIQPACATYTTQGTYSFVVPNGISNVCVLCVSAGQSGQGGCCSDGGGGGSGGNLSFTNYVAVTPGETLTVLLGGGGYSNCCLKARVSRSSTVLVGAKACDAAPCIGVGATQYFGGSGSGPGGPGSNFGGGGGGAAGYEGNGNSGTGGSAADGPLPRYATGGGGVGLYGYGDIARSGSPNSGQGGSGGGCGTCYGGGNYGGGGRGGDNSNGIPGPGGQSAVRIIWGRGKSFPFYAS